MKRIPTTFAACMFATGVAVFDAPSPICLLTLAATDETITRHGDVG